MSYRTQAIIVCDGCGPKQATAQVKNERDLPDGWVMIVRNGDPKDSTFCPLCWKRAWRAIWPDKDTGEVVERGTVADLTHFAAAPLKAQRFEFAGVKFYVSAPNGGGASSGRNTYAVQCLTCNVEVHAQTTGPAPQIEFHLRDVHQIRDYNLKAQAPAAPSIAIGTITPDGPIEDLGAVTSIPWFEAAGPPGPGKSVRLEMGGAKFFVAGPISPRGGYTVSCLTCAIRLDGETARAGARIVEHLRNKHGWVLPVSTSPGWVMPVHDAKPAAVSPKSQWIAEVDRLRVILEDVIDKLPVGCNDSRKLVAIAHQDLGKLANEMQR